VLSDAMTAGRTSLQRAAIANALAPSLMSAADRLDEVGEILAAGFLRCCARAEQSNCQPSVEAVSQLDFAALQSVHPTVSVSREDGSAQ